MPANYAHLLRAVLSAGRLLALLATALSTSGATLLRGGLLRGLLRGLPAALALTLAAAAAAALAVPLDLAFDVHRPEADLAVLLVLLRLPAGELLAEDAADGDADEDDHQGGDDHQHPEPVEGGDEGARLIAQRHAVLRRPVALVAVLGAGLRVVGVLALLLDGRIGLAEDVDALAGLSLDAAGDLQLGGLLLREVVRPLFVALGDGSEEGKKL